MASQARGGCLDRCFGFGALTPGTMRGIGDQRADAGLVSFVEPGSALTPDLPISSSWSRRRSPALPGRPRSGPAWHPDHPKTSCAVVARTRALPVRGS
ncbi:hypothetical protein SAMN05446589_10105 [Streptomyces sp. OV198]|jgi:hypothetical protein|nr:hypothetical protein SAMN05446589_10105 [Streptomyces sp. OV198]